VGARLYLAGDTGVARLQTCRKPSTVSSVSSDSK
jgi:hypothetical protein